MVGSETKDGFCGVAGQCLFIDPPKIGPPKFGETCSTDDDCESGLTNPRPVISLCDRSIGRCRYVTPPADLAAGLPAGDNGKPFAKLKVTLNANRDASATPVLYNWEARYVCREVR